MTDAIAVLDAAEIDERYQPTRTRAVICMDSDLVLRIDRLDQQVRQAQLGDSAADPVSDLAMRVLELREQARASEIEFVFHSIGRRAYRDLVRENPATAEQKAELEPGERLPFNPETFPPALLAASCESVRNGTVAWWTRKCDEWGEGQFTRLWRTALAAQDGVNETPKGANASAAMRLRDASSE